MHNLIKLAYIYTKSNNNKDITVLNNHRQDKFFALNLKPITLSNPVSNSSL